MDLAIEGKCFLLADKLMAAGGKPQQSKKLKFKDALGKKLKRVVGKVSVFEQIRSSEIKSLLFIYSIQGEMKLEEEGEEEEESEDEEEGDVLYRINMEEDVEEEESSDEEDEPSEEPEDTWMAPILAELGTPAHLIYLVEEKLVRQEGFGSAQTLARVPPSLYSRAYLNSLGICGLGLQQVLLDFHNDLHHDFVQQKRHQSQTGGATQSQPQQSAQEAATPKASKEHKEHKEHRQSKDRGGGGGVGGSSAQHPSEPQLSSTVKSAKKRTHQDSLQHLEGSGGNNTGAGGESPTAGTGTGTASASTTPGSSKRQAVQVHHADG